jgi:PKD repeat protein
MATFTATITGGTSALYTWDFGDGITLTGHVVEHIYQFPGEYAVAETATKSLGFVRADTVAVINPSSFFLPFTFK